jgi:PAS domain S-box-containing protein
MSHAASLLKFWNASAPLRLLLLEPVTPDAESILQHLKRAGFQCRAKLAATLDDFLAQLPRFDFDIVLADYLLPGWTGLDALARLRQTGRDVPFILVTATLGEEVAVECIKQGATDYVLKDHLARLPIVVARALEEKSHRDARTLMVEALRQSEASFRLLFANNPLPMWVFDWQSLEFLQVNDAAVSHYGFERIEFLQMKIQNLHPPEEASRLLSILRNGPPGGQFPGTWHHRLKSGVLIDVEIFAHRMEYSHRVAALAVALDVTERKRTEEEKQKFLTLVENSRDLIAVADLRGRVQYVNPAGRTLLGLASTDTVKGTVTRHYVSSEDLALVRDTVIPTLRSTGQWQGELKMRHQQTGQALPVDCVMFLVKDPVTRKARFVATVSRDISERRALERKLQQAQKFEAIGQLAGGIAHDFNNVIGAVVGWAELGEEQAAAGGPKIAGYFRKIRVQCDRAAALIRQLLAFARRQIIEPRNLNLNQSVHEVLSLLDKVIGKDIEIQTSLAEDLPVVRADSTQIEQVMMNLCINARDAMPDGGHLHIETRTVEFTPEECRPNPSLQAGRFVRLTVRDTGMGMDAAVREHIFEPFFTTKGPGKGTGLGLATVYGIVKQNGGFIQVESQPDQGSTFQLYLPGSADSSSPGPSSPLLHTGPVRGGTETILVAEDHDGIREMAKATLESLGYRVLLAHDGE